MVDCPVPTRVRVELGGGSDVGILNRLSATLGELVVDGGDGSDALTGDHVTDTLRDPARWARRRPP